MSDRPEDLLNCGVCLEEYQDSGSRIPRLLPCTHTLCERCLIELLGQQGGAKLTCPECREQHAAPRKQRTFPQNKYLLMFIKWRNTAQSKKSEEEPDRDTSLCPDHGKELTLFCKETQCQTLICSVCMTRKHKKHDVVDVDENRKEKLLDNLTSAIQRLSFKKEQITTVQEKNEQCLKKLKEDKRTILNLVQDKYDSMISEASNQTEEHKSKITSLEENLVLLNNIKQYISTKTLSPSEMKNCQETVNSVIEHNDQAPLELRYMGYPGTKNREQLVEEMCRELVQRIHITLKWSVKTIYTRYFNLCLSTAGKDSVVIGGWDIYTGTSMVTHYNLVTGEERCTVGLDCPPWGMTTVLHDNQSCIAVSNGKKIEFRPVGNLEQVVDSLDVTPHYPDYMCAVTSSPSQLLYWYKDSGKIHLVDCSTTPPTLQGEKPIVYGGKEDLSDMCTSRDLLVVARGVDGVFAYTLDVTPYTLYGGKLKWEVSGELPGMHWDMSAEGVTADDNGHLFVCDEYNRCVHLLSAQDGAHLGAVVREWREVLVRPQKVIYHRKSASVIFAHEVEEMYQLSVSSHEVTSCSS